MATIPAPAPPSPPARDERQRRKRDSPISHFATGFPPRWRSRHVPPCSLAAARTRVLFAYFAASPKGWSRARRWRGGSGFRERPRGVTYGRLARPKDCHLAGNFGLLRERGITGAANTASRLLPHLATVAYPLARDAHLPEYLPPSPPPPCPPPQVTAEGRLWGECHGQIFLICGAMWHMIEWRVRRRIILLCYAWHASIVTPFRLVLCHGVHVCNRPHSSESADV